MVYDVHRARYGTKRWNKMINVRCWLNGLEVTRRCFYADPRRGVVRMHKHENGRPYINWSTGEIAQEEGRGRVVVRKAA